MRRWRDVMHFAYRRAAGLSTRSIGPHVRCARSRRVVPARPVDGIAGRPDPGHAKRMFRRATAVVLPAVLATGCSLVRHAPPPETSHTVEVGTASWYGNEFRG